MSTAVIIELADATADDVVSALRSAGVSAKVHPVDVIGVDADVELREMYAPHRQTVRWQVIRRTFTVESTETRYET